MAVRGQMQAESELSELFDVFRGAVQAATAHFWTAHKADVADYTDHTRARLIRDLIVRELKARLIGRPGTAVLDENQTTLFCIGANWILRVHKIRESGHIALNNTQIALDLNDNIVGETPWLPGLPDGATMLYLGYKENIARPMSPEVVLVCPDGGSPAWVLSLGEPPAAVTGDITPPAPDSGPKRVRVIKDKAKKLSD